MPSGTPEQFHPSEDKFQPTLSEKELLDIERTIDKLHLEKKADPKGVHIMESLSLPDSWLNFMERGGKVLSLSEEEQERLEALFEKLLEGKLNDPDEEISFHELAKLKERFDELTTH